MSPERMQCHSASARAAPARVTRASLTALSGLFVFAFTLTAPAKDTAPSIADAFAETTTTLKVMPDTPGKEVTWSYTNHTDVPLAIERIDISCGCLSALTLAKKRQLTHHT